MSKGYSYNSETKKHSLSLRPKGRRTSLWPKIKIVVAVIAIVLIAVLTWQYLKARSELSKYNDPSKAIQQESEDTVAEVGKIMVLPTGEQPVPAKIQDVSKFKDNPAFDNAQNGDVVLIYREQKRLIIYRPSTKQIVWSAIYNSEPTEEPATEPTPQQ